MLCLLVLLTFAQGAWAEYWILENGGFDIKLNLNGTNSWIFNGSTKRDSPSENYKDYSANSATEIVWTEFSVKTGCNDNWQHQYLFIFYRVSSDHSGDFTKYVYNSGSIHKNEDYEYYKNNFNLDILALASDKGINGDFYFDYYFGIDQGNTNPYRYAPGHSSQNGYYSMKFKRSSCPTPTLTSVTGDTDVEQGSQHTYTANGGSPGTGATISRYNWTLPDGWSGTSTTNTITATVGNSAGSKTIKCTVTNSCGSTSAEKSLSVNVANKWEMMGLGGYCSWTPGSGCPFTGDGDVVTYTKEINNTGDKEFKLYFDTWYGDTNEGTITRNNCTDWTMVDASQKNNTKINVDIAGTYVFSLNKTTKKLSVTYPTSCTPPTITSHPSTDAKTYTQGETATALSVTASGTAPLSYQWKQSLSADGSYENVTGGTGANTATYTPSTDNIGKLYYKCYVSNSCGNVTSNASGAITVNAGSDITVTPASPKAYEVITLSTRSGGDMTWSKTADNDNDNDNDNAYFVNADGTTTSGPTTPTNSIKFKAPAGSYTITATPATGDSNEIIFTVGPDSDDCN